MSIAGHAFTDGICTCGRKRTDLAGVTRAAVGQEGWAHSGMLTDGEYREIMEDQPPSVLRGVSTQTAGTDRLYHDCDMSTELVTSSSDAIQIEHKTWYLVRCGKCDVRGRVSAVWPVVHAN
jgi:hypothetical protein